ncbi:MAG TPA: hypothetical protein VFW13_06450 [Phenylobacterium sp.]|nr:hypothetical protein [Phenylobacterium sp.]
MASTSEESQRRLAAERAGFADLLAQVRRDLALRYLGDPVLSVTEIAQLLGYNQLSSFIQTLARRPQTVPVGDNQRAGRPVCAD